MDELTTRLYNENIDQNSSAYIRVYTVLQYKRKNLSYAYPLEVKKSGVIFGNHAPIKFQIKGDLVQIEITYACCNNICSYLR